MSGGSKLPIYLDDFFEMAGARFTCFTSTGVQILTLEELFEMAGIPIVVGYGLTETRCVSVFVLFGVSTFVLGKEVN